MRLIVLLLSLIMACGSSVLLDTSTIHQDRIREHQSGVLAIVWNGFPIGSGSYLMIDDVAYLVTAKHLLDALDTIMNSNTHMIPLICVGDHYRLTECVPLDLQLERIDEDDVVRIKLPSLLVTAEPDSFNTNYDPTPGEAIYTIGFPMHQLYIYSHGLISGIADSQSFLADISATEGNSGGPVFNQNGEVIGVVIGWEYVFYGNDAIDRTPDNILHVDMFGSWLLEH